MHVRWLPRHLGRAVRLAPWIGAADRRQGVILIAGNALFGLLERNPQAAPLRFRVKATNDASRHLVAGALAPAVEPLFSTQTWTSY